MVQFYSAPVAQHASAIDTVLQTANNYDKGLFNGDQGGVAEIDVDASRIRVVFDGTLVDYDFSELDELQPSYSMTVHRAQGNEFPAVVVPVLMQHYPMLQRNLLYTAITRGRKLVVLVGSRRALAIATSSCGPVILPKYIEEFWADGSVADPEALRSVLTPLPDDATEPSEVSSLINSTANYDPRVIARLP